MKGENEEEALRKIARCIPFVRRYILKQKRLQTELECEGMREATNAAERGALFIDQIYKEKFELMSDYERGLEIGLFLGNKANSLDYLASEAELQGNPSKVKGVREIQAIYTEKEHSLRESARQFMSNKKRGLEKKYDEVIQRIEDFVLLPFEEEGR